MLNFLLLLYDRWLDSQKASELSLATRNQCLKLSRRHIKYIDKHRIGSSK